MSRLLKKYFLQYEYLQLELEDIEEIYVELQKNWHKDYAKYFKDRPVEAWMNEETGEVKFQDPNIEEELTKDKTPEQIKKLYRKLSTITHPDKGGDVEDFNKVRACYEDKDYVGLLLEASKYADKIEVEEQDRPLLDASCEKLQEKIKNKRHSLLWMLYKGTEQEKAAAIAQLEATHNIKIT